MAPQRRSAHGRRLWVLGLLVLLAAVAIQPQRCLIVGQRAVQATLSAMAALVLQVFIGLDWQGSLRPSRGGLEEPGAPCADVSLRVARGLGSRGYGAVRVTAVCTPVVGGAASEEELDRCPPAGMARRGAARAFDQCGRFKQRWTHFHTSSAVVDVGTGEGRLGFNHSSGPLQVEVSLPPRGAGVHGVVIGDPCISSRYMPGLCDMRFDVLNRLPRFLNRLSEVDRLDFVVLLGDAFYDVHGSLTADFWRRLSKKTQETFLMSVPGNHDFWMFAPQAPLPQDQLGIGFVQWYGQDTAQSVLAEPVREGPPTGLPAAEEFFFYHTIGDVGFLGFSNAHPWEAQERLFQEACDYFVAEQPNQVYILGHWSKEDLGCQPGMDVPSLYRRLRGGLCRPVAQRMRYLMGHDHCNEASADGLGFLVGAGGAAHGGCNEWGVAYLDTRTPPASAGRAHAKPRRARLGGGADDDVGAVGNAGAAPLVDHVVAKVTLATDTSDYFPALEACLSTRRSLLRCLPERHSEIWVNGTALIA